MKKAYSLLIVCFFVACSEVVKKQTLEEKVQETIENTLRKTLKETAPLAKLDTVAILLLDTLSDKTQALHDLGAMESYLTRKTKILEKEREQIERKISLKNLGGADLGIREDTIAYNKKKDKYKKMLSRSWELLEKKETMDSTNFLGYYVIVNYKISDEKGIQSSMQNSIRVSPDFKVMRNQIEGLDD